MPATIEAFGLADLPLEEKITLAEQLWENIALDMEKVPLTVAQIREIDRRLAVHRANPDSAIPWETVEAEAITRLSQ